MVFFIMASCIELCFYDVTLVPGSTKAKILYSFDIVFLIVFGIEAVMKIIHTGFLFNGKWSYLRNPWNILDLVVIAAMILVMVLEGKVGSRDIVWLRALRAFRALRSMKVATKLDGMRAVVRSMGLAIPAVLEVLLVASLFYFIFSILGVNLLGGKLFFCAQVTPGQPPQPSQYMDPHYFLANGMNINSSWCNAGEQNITTSWYHSGLVLLQPFPSYTVTTTWGANVQTSTSPIYNLRFDNTYQSLWVLISMTSLENWSPLMYQAMTVTDVEFQPILSPPPSPYLAFFFVFFVFFCVFFVLSLVISVCIDKFNKFRQLTGGRNLLLTEEQQQWLRVQHIMLTIKPKKKVVIPSNPIRSFCYRLSMTEAFDRFMVSPSDNAVSHPTPPHILSPLTLTRLL